MGKKEDHMNDIIRLKDSTLDFTKTRKISYEKGSKIEKFKDGSIIPIINDEMFKTLFSREENIKFPCKLLSYILDISYEELLEHLHFTKNETGKKKKEETSYRQDLVVEINGMVINIEMNNNPSEIVRERNLSYLFRLREDRKNKEEYQPVIQVNLNNFCYQGETSTREDFCLLNGKGLIYTEKMIIIDIYLPNIRRKCYNKKEELTEMERFLLIGIEENQKKALEYVGDDIVMKEFSENIKRSSEEWDLIEAYDKEWAMKDWGRQEGRREGIKEGIQEGKKEGIKEGMEKGRHKEKLSIAKGLFRKGIDISIIADCTGLTEKEILELKEG